MFRPYEIMIAIRYLRAKRKEGVMSAIALLSFLGVSLGVAALIIVMAVMSGFRKELTAKILGFAGHITVSAYEKGIIGYDAIAKELETLDGVLQATPVINAHVMSSSKWGSGGAMVRGIRPADLQRKSLINDNLTSGSLEDFSGKNAIVIGERLAAILGSGIGDKVTIISSETTPTAIGPIPRIKSYEVVATFASGMYEYDVSTIYMPLEAAQLLFRHKDTVSAIEVTTTDPEDLRMLTANITNMIQGLYSVRNWKMDNFSLVNALKVEQTVMFLILTIIIIVAAFNIISSLIMLVNDKQDAIAILRTMGAGRSSIMRIFFICGSFIGIVGTVLGVILGTAFALNIEELQKLLSSMVGFQLFDPVVYFLSELPADVRLDNVLLVSVMAITISFLATLYPALKAARLNPVRILRHE